VAPVPPLALAYHGVADVPPRRDPHGLFVRPADLRRHVERLRAWEYRLVPFGELAAAARGGAASGLAALTFDDGLVDNLETLVPLLAELEAPATVFVASGLLGRPHPDAPWTRVLTADEVAAAAAAGLEIGSHGSAHRDLSALPQEEARADLARSRDELAAILGRPPAVASYPFGQASAETRAAARDAGFEAACRANGLGSWSDPWDLPREDMENGAGLLGLRLKRAGRYEPLMRHRPLRAARRVGRGLRALAR
jgi:peptidoglycan/xylan/chitin deacetylase (PgdA/CDA1 family)